MLVMRLTREADNLTGELTRVVVEGGADGVKRMTMTTRVIPAAGYASHQPTLLMLDIFLSVFLERGHPL